MKKWAIVRVVLLALGFTQGAMMRQAVVPPGSETFLLPTLAFCFGILGLVFVVGLQRLNPFSAPAWRYPSWAISPFLLGEPLQFFHFVGYFMIAAGSGMLFRHVLLADPLLLAAMVPLALGIGLLVGVWVCTLVFRGKMVRT